MANDIIVDGYSFTNKMDAQLAETERKKVEYLRKHLDHGNPDTVLALYNKSISERIFRTPVGLEFLRELQTYLIQDADVSPTEVPAIPLYLNYTGEVAYHGKVAQKRVDSQKTEKDKVSFGTISIILNIILLIAVIAMFVITLKADNPNILNYETNLVNKYSYWEQELTEREYTIREKEKELGIDNQ